MTEQEPQSRLGKALEAADQPDQASQEALLARSAEIEPAPALRKPDLVATHDQLECEQRRDDLEDMRRATSRQRESRDPSRSTNAIAKLF